jgi:hypothetical protein
MLDNSAKFIYTTTSSNGTIFETMFVYCLDVCPCFITYLEFNVFVYVRNEKREVMAVIVTDGIND